MRRADCLTVLFNVFRFFQISARMTDILTFGLSALRQSAKPTNFQAFTSLKSVSKIIQA
jgi:hypothetical protein